MTEPTGESAGQRVGNYIKIPFRWLDTGLNFIEKSILIVGILAMATVSVINVFARNLGASLSFADEVAQLLVVVVTFVGVGHGVRNARHIRVSAIHDLLPPVGQKILLTVVSFVSCALLALLAVYAWEYVMKLQTTGRRMPSLGMPLWTVYLIAPVGLAVGSAQFLLAGVRNLVSPGAWLSWHHPDEYEAELDELTSEVGLADEFWESDLQADDKKKSSSQEESRD
ncbi:MAG: TRAP transporter small permease subunit [Marinobacter sp.]|uniref:TRAP transporter small permease n=1 Tax=Marinobacter sp. TaxID=50741 RepID=UPI00299F3877|nr:TRAP transporter small permease subunit [Marinobacter sp.]MDX1756528.1 TRAP transporter small permease subunit [Marinobacter sp.]